MSIVKLSLIHRETSAEIGYLRYYVERIYDHAKVQAGIVYMYIDESWRGRGLSKWLMYLFFEKMHQLSASIDSDSVKVCIELEDMSDLARTPESIYVLFGFQYVHKHTNEPEMIMNGTCHQFQSILSKWAPVIQTLQTNYPSLHHTVVSKEY